jgi:hypothetical protein
MEIERSKSSACFALALLLSIAVRESWAAERVILDRATVIADAAEPEFVRYGIEDLAGYLKDSIGVEIPTAALPSKAKGAKIFVGTNAARQVLPNFSDEKLGEEGYLLQSLTKDGEDCVVAAGHTPRGTKAALSALMKSIRMEGRSAFVPAALNVVGAPPLAKRGMHFNGWAFNPPYSFRTWREEDWRSYLDILAYQGVNLFYLWPFIEIMPVPLSPEDRAYLEECRRVVDYAQKKHGMEVWIMQCTNRVAQDRCGVADPRYRPYWRPAQKDLNPGNLEHFKAIMDSREAMYRILDNVDGVCNIDADPGYYPGSPLSDYYKVLEGCRELLDRHNLHGKDAKLIDWMWTGWGRADSRTGLAAHQQTTIQGLKQNLREPWGLVAGWGDLLPICRKENVLEKTVFLPYGVIEGEPSYPATNLDFEPLRKQFADYAVKNPEAAGVMGNEQTPLLQFPHVFYFTSAMFDAEYRYRSEKDILLDLCEYLYPERRELIADCYLALRESDPEKIQTLADRLNDLVRENELGRLGLFGRKLFPDRSIVAQTLVLQLNFRAASQRLAESPTPSASQTDCEKLLCDYFDAYLAWDTAHGWHKLWGWKSWPIGVPKGVAEKIATAFGSASELDACFDRVAKQLEAKYDKTAVGVGCLAPLKGDALAAIPIATLAQKAKATASVEPNRSKHPAGHANDGKSNTLYWPGALTENNSEWLQLTWDGPQTFDKVVVRFLQHPSMPGRTIHLQKETATGTWEDFATAVIPADAGAQYAVATFELGQSTTLDKIRIVNLLDLFEIEVTNAAED